MTDFNISFPIDMVKKEQRIVSGIATADNIDKSNDIVDFEASREAFANWGGNIREMHAPIAVGKAVKYEPVTVQGPDGKIYNAFKVEAYISKGAEDTWQKVLDGTLRSFSIGGKVLQKEEMTDKMHNGRPINIIKKYVLGELSLVDNPANALAIIDLVKMNDEGDLNYALDCDLDCQLAKAKQPLKDPKGGLTAAGRRHFKETEGANLKPGVRGAADTPEKMRRKGSFLTRFFTNPSGPMKKPNGEPTRLALSAAAWGEPVPQDMSDAAKLAAKGRRLLERYAKTKEKSEIENTFEDAILEGLLDLLEKDGCDCGCGTCEDISKDGLGAGGGAPAVSVATDNAESKYPSQGKFKTPTMANSPSGYPKFKPKKKKKKEKNMNSEDPINKDIGSEDGLVPTLQGLMANVIVFYASAHRAHWNVEGVDFTEYHELFERIYEDVYGSIDPLAELVRKMGAYPPSFSEAEDMADYEDDSATTVASELAMDLYTKNMQLISMLKNAFNVANAANEQGVANFIAERIDMHQTWDWQLLASLKVAGVQIPSLTPEDEADAEDASPSAAQVMNMLNEIFANSEKTEEISNNDESKFDIINHESKNMDSIIKQDVELQENDNYDKISDMNEQEAGKLSLLKKFVGWLFQDVAETTSTSVEVSGNTQEEEMDINILKDALSAVVDEKLASFATSIKEEVEASVQEKIEAVAKGFEVQSTELQQKLETAELALAEQTEKVEAFAAAGAVKKSVDPEEEEEEGEALVKSAPASFWRNTYLPQELINSLGYRS
jgi:DNA-binding ferritin-like protein